MTRGAASKLIDRLVPEAGSLAERTDDRRYQDIGLTAVGHGWFKRDCGDCRPNDAEFFTVLSVREHAALVATLKKLVQAHGFDQIPTE
jgi:hypothetical protein